MRARPPRRLDRTLIPTPCARRWTVTLTEFSVHYSTPINTPRHLPSKLPASLARDRSVGQKGGLALWRLGELGSQNCS